MRYIVHPSTGELQQGIVEGVVSGEGKEISFRIFEVLGVDAENQLVSVGTELTEPVGNVAVQIPFLLCFSILGGKTLIYRSRLLKIEEVGVYDSSLLGLVGPVEDLKDVPADQLVITVDGEYDGVPAAVVDGSEVEVGEGRGPVGVFEVGVALLVDGEEGEVGPVDLVAAVGGAVVDDHHPVVRVVLREDRVEARLDAEARVVVVARHDEAHRQLLPHSRQSELGLEPYPVPPVQFHCLLQLLVTAYQVVFAEDDVRVIKRLGFVIGGVTVGKGSPFLNELNPQSPGLFFLVEHFLDRFAVFVSLSKVDGQRMVLILSIGHVDDLTRPDSIGRWLCFVTGHLGLSAILQFIGPAQLVDLCLFVGAAEGEEDYYRAHKQKGQLILSAESCIGCWEFGRIKLVFGKGVGLEGLESLVASVAVPLDLHFGPAAIELPAG